MLNCESCQNALADSLYERLSEADQSAVDEHFSGCSTCRELFDELTDSTLRLRKVTEEGAVLATEATANAQLDNLWVKLEPDLDRVDAQRFRRLAGNSFRRFAGAGLAVAASVILFIAVAYQPGSRENQPAPIISPVAQTQEATEFLNYLGRAQTVLLVLANTDRADSSAIPLDRRYVELMAVEANLLNASMQNQLSASQRELLRDVQYLLLQFANFEDEDLVEGLEILQLYLQDNTVLFRINLAEIKEQAQVI
ncbi:MAG: hypothetical protein WDZ76_14640 [Pseudohongiellaceae bacterium]